MALVELKIPPGFYRNGTRLQSAGRWRDGNLVRFRSGTLRPIGGWSALPADPVASDAVTGLPRALRTYIQGDGLSQAVLGTTNGLFGLAEGVTTSIAPLDLAAPVVDSGFADSAYGAGPYGAGPYGFGEGTTLATASTWSLDTFGATLVAVRTGDGRLLFWEGNPATRAAAVAGAPTQLRGCVVTPERHVVALGTTWNGTTFEANPRGLAWASQESLTEWEPTELNTAGDFILEGDGAILAGRRAAQETLIWTTNDLWAMRYSGPPFVYGVVRVGDKCGAIGPNAMCVVDSMAAWMGASGFYMYDGTVRPLPCEVEDAVFSDFNRLQAAKVCAFSMGDLNEIWWLYPSASSLENNRYVIWNYRENHWVTGSLDRTCGSDRGPFSYPLLAASDNVVYEHERGHDTGELVPFIESGPIALGSGDTVMTADYLRADERTSGDVRARFLTSLHPDGAETVRGPYTLGKPTSIRWTARYARIALEQVRSTDWRYGTVVLDLKPGGLR